MSTRLPISTRILPIRLHGLHTADRPFSGLAARFTAMWRTVRDVLTVCSRANAAAHHYEDLKRLSDADLAAKGLVREDLPRAALRKLSEDH